jgi:hypothetical protein
MRPPLNSFRRKSWSSLALALAAVVLAGCETDGNTPGPLASLSSPAKKEGPAKADPPMTHARAASECWMSTEKGRADTNLDKRADFVTKCIDEKMKKTEAAPKT